MNWERSNLGVVTTPVESVSPADLFDHAFDYIDIASIDRDAKRIVETKRILVDEAPSRARQLVRQSDVIVSTVRPNLNAVAAVPPELDGAIASTGFCVLRAEPRLIHHRFLFYRVLTQDFIRSMVAQATGASYPAVSDRIIKMDALGLPHLREQERIVELLDRAYALRDERSLADGVIDGIRDHVFENWFSRVETIGRVSDVLESCQYGTSEKAVAGPDAVAVIRMNNILSSGWLDLSDLKYTDRDVADVARFGLRPGDLLFNRTNSRELVGKTAIWSDGPEAVYASYLIRLRTHRQVMCPEFLWAHLNSPNTKRVLFQLARKAIGMANINTREIGGLGVPLAPMSKQEQFVRFIERLSEVRKAQTASRSQLETLFQTLLIRAFDGRLTAKWREAHARELCRELAYQHRAAADATRTALQEIRP